MFIVITKKGIEVPDLTGDGTGYSLTVSRHYRSLREKYGDKIKSNENNIVSKDREGKKKIIVYAFALMDIDTKLYVGYGASIKSERDAFEKAVIMMQLSDVTPSSIRLDQYYGGRSTITEFPRETTVYVIPKKDALLEGSEKWKELIDSLVLDPMQFLSEYYLRENSESGFSADKRCDGWKIWQKREDRIETATMCKGMWHNLFLLGSRR